MDSEVIDNCLKEVPFEIRAAVKPLSKDKTWAVFIIILKRGNLRFNEIKEFFNTGSPGEIDRILKSLAAAGLIAKRASDFNNLGEPSGYSYCPTYLGKSVISALFHGVFPSHEKTSDIPVPATTSSFPVSTLQMIQNNPMVCCFTPGPVVLMQVSPRQKMRGYRMGHTTSPAGTLASMHSKAGLKKHSGRPSHFS